MRNLLIKIIAFLKSIFFLLHPGTYLGFLTSPLIFIGNSLKLSKWILLQRKKQLAFDDFFKFKRNYNDRFKLHGYIAESEKLIEEQIYFWEFGVAGGTSFEWWLKKNKNPDSMFLGFDTFEGLPEDWGIFKKGEMSPDELKFQDRRYKFIKGLFQDTLPKLLNTSNLDPRIKKVIHLDADLFSSTLFTLTSIANYLNPGDILIFDEFCVPNHEFFAFSIFEESFRLRYKTLGAVNNYLQVALKVIE